MDHATPERAAPMTNLVQELAAEAFGAPKKKWVLVVFAFFAGAVVILKLQARANRSDADATPAAASDDAAPSAAAEAAAASNVGQVPMLLTKVQTSNERVRAELSRWTRLPMARWQSARNPAESPQQSPPPHGPNPTR
jgi:hypothetical protein